MPREAIIQVRRDRNAALVDSMLLAASADGRLVPVELEVMLRRVLERPEFEGTSADELRQALEGSARRLSHASTLETVLDSLRERLPEHHNRLLAFGLAVSVALADQQASRDELGLLKTMQAALGVSEEEVSRIFEAVQAGTSLADALGEPLERLLAETMVLVAAADGVMHEKEIVAMLESFAGDPTFQGTSAELAERFLMDAVQHLAESGVESRLTVLARGLSSRAHRRKAYELAVRVAHADGPPGARKTQVLGLLQATFGLADDEVARITAET